MQTKIFNRRNFLFNDKTFLDCAVMLRKMSSMRDLVPLVKKSMGFSDSWIPRKEMEKYREAMESRIADVEKTLRNDADFGSFPAIPCMAELYHEIGVPLWQVFFIIETMQASPRRGVMPWEFDAEEKRNMIELSYTVSEHDLLDVVMQLNVLWRVFRNPMNTLTVVSKDAFDLVSNTRFDEKVTRDMMDSAFPDGQVVVVTMEKPYKDYYEFYIERIGELLQLGLGPKMVKRPDDPMHTKIYSRTFDIAAVIDIGKQYGCMTSDSITDSADQLLMVEDPSEDGGRTELYGTEVENDPDEEVRRFREKRHVFHRDVVSWLVMFAMKLRLMLTSERAPIEEARSSSGRGVWKAGVEMPPEKGVGIKYSVVSLTKDFYDARARYEKSAGCLDKEGKSLVEKQVCGHLRRQHYGPKSSLTKYIYVAPFVNRFWVSENVVHVTKVVK